MFSVFVRLFVHLFVRSFVRLFVRSFVRPFVRPFVLSFVRLFVRPFVRSFSRSFDNRPTVFGDLLTGTEIPEGWREEGVFSSLSHLGAHVNVLYVQRGDRLQ